MARTFQNVRWTGACWIPKYSVAKKQQNWK
jgi:hypothetical protein